ERRRRRAQLRPLPERTREFARSTGDYHVLLDLVARRLGEIVGETCVIRMLTPDGEYFETIDGLYHPDASLVQEWRDYLHSTRQRYDEGLTGRVLSTGQPILIASTSTDQLASSILRSRSMVARLAIRSVMGVPLRSEGKPIGVAIMTRSDPDKPYTPDDLELLEDLASHASIAITNSKLVEALKRELAERRRKPGRLKILSVLTREFGEATGVYRRLLDVI